MVDANVEIERKFRVRADPRLGESQGIEIRQGYLARTPRGVVRVRIAGDRAFLTIKGKQHSLTRSEFEYEIPVADATQLLSLCEGAPIEKTRHRVEHAAHIWEIDVFSGANQGLVLAEIELEREDESFERPSWLGDEVSHDPRYQNSNLSGNPWRSSWDDD